MRRKRQDFLEKPRRAALVGNERRAGSKVVALKTECSLLAAAVSLLLILGASSGS